MRAIIRNRRKSTQSRARVRAKSLGIALGALALSLSGQLEAAPPAQDIGPLLYRLEAPENDGPCRANAAWRPLRSFRQTAQGPANLTYHACLRLPGPAVYPELRHPALLIDGLGEDAELRLGAGPEAPLLFRIQPPTPDTPFRFSRDRAIVAPLPDNAAGRVVVLKIRSPDGRVRAPDAVRLGEEAGHRVAILLGQLDLLILGSLFFFAGLLCAPMAVQFSGQRSSWLAFSTFMSAMGLLSIAISEPGRFLLERNLGAHAASYAAYAAIFAAPALFCLFNASLVDPARRQVLGALWKIHAGFAVLAALAFAWFGFGVQKGFLGAYFLLLILVNTAVIGIALRDARDGRSGSRLYAGGLALFAATIIYDALGGYFQFVPWERYTFHWGLFALLGVIAYVIQRRVAFARETMHEYARELESANADLAGLNHAYSRFVPREFLKLLGKTSITEVELGDNAEVEVTLMVSDIHSFTTLSENMTPEDNFKFINGYFSRLGAIIRGNHGFIAKYMGDGIMGVFPRKASDAVDAALALHKELVNYNKAREERGRGPVQTGIGIHSGVVRLGTVGDGERMQGDVMSDAANLTARIEGLTRTYGALIVLSEHAFHSLDDPEAYEYRVLDVVRVKGKSRPVQVVEILVRDGDPHVAQKLATRTQFKEGVLLYNERRFAEACDLFQKVLNVNEDDTAARLYYDRSLFYAMNGPPQEWQGIEEMKSK